MSACRSCRAEVLWVETVPAGKRIPLDPPGVDFRAHGAIIVVGRFGYTLKELAERLALREAVSVARAEELIGARYDAHVSHFATCPQAAQHRR